MSLPDVDGFSIRRRPGFRVGVVSVRRTFGERATGRAMKVVVIASLPASLVHFRGELLRAIIARGHGVTAVAPDASEEVTAWLADAGIEFRGIPMERTGLDPVADLRSLRALVGVMRATEPDIVVAYTAKPVIYGLLGARLARTGQRVALITGRGSALAGGDGPKQRVLGSLMRTLYRIALQGASVVLFQNPDDEGLFRSTGLIQRGQRCVRINGSGVDLEHYAPAPAPSGPMTFLMIGRLLREKGVFEYVGAARIVREAHPSARFLLVGGLDPKPSSISEADLRRLHEDGTVQYLGEVSDVRPAIASANVIVLPSYHEGTPRSILEGMSMARAVITTDVPGCRETVEPRRNGLLVPAREPEILARAMSDLIEQPELAAAMGTESRRIAEARFDVHDVNGDIIEAIGL